jgi:hypothetical protein
MLQAGRFRVIYPMVSLEFFIDTVTLGLTQHLTGMSTRIISLGVKAVGNVMISSMGFTGSIMLSNIVTNHEMSALLGFYGAWNGSSERTFRHNFSLPCSRVKQSKQSQKCADLIYIAAKV